ncbi:MAG: efflux RND transporter periplasmic adaptor subunit [Candidatus Melainabacteria bacterium]|nr:efflux RND transporter periplasmic adaptor subunit [Candidatus Melainabacteria bacterium]
MKEELDTSTKHDKPYPKVGGEFEPSTAAVATNSANSKKSNRAVLVSLIVLLLVGSAATVYSLRHGKDSKEGASGPSAQGQAGRDSKAGENSKGGPGGKGGKDKIVPVLVATSGERALPIELRSIGNVAPFSVVNITPQVGGQLLKVHFTQGDFVKKGQLLFQIDPRSYQASLAQAEGNVARDKAQIEAAQANLARDETMIGQAYANLRKDKAQAKYTDVQVARYAELVREGAVSKEQSDQIITSAAQAQATIDADMKMVENAQAVTRGDRAAIETARGNLGADQGLADQARLQLSWTKIYSPLDGRTGSLNVYEGNVVSPNSTTPLVTIAQVNPIYVNVTVPEQYLNDLRRSQANGTLKIKALVEGRKAEAVKGHISFMENTVNTNTGTILLRASFDNAGHKLFPGQFVDVVISMPPAGKSVVVPARAVQTTQQGNSVYVLKPDNTVDLVKVKLGQSSGELIAVLDGLKVGQTVVTDGQLQLSPGSKVKVQRDTQAVDVIGK